MMGTAERKERQKAELRQQILSAARQIVIDGGFGALTMRKIAEAIEYSPGTIYLHFQNRDDIAKQLCIQGFQELLDCLQPFAAMTDPRERLVAITQVYIRFGMSHSETYHLTFMEHPTFTNAIFQDAPIDYPDGPGYQAFGFLVQAFDDLKASFILSPECDSVHFAEMFWAALHGIVSLKLTSPAFPASSAESLGATMVTTLLDGLPGNPTSKAKQAKR